MEMDTESEPKERIIDLAEHRFLQSGFNKVTLDELSGELGISKKTMYKFFPSKEDLVRTMVRMFMKKVERQFTRIYDAETPVVQKLAEIMLMVGTVAGKMGRPFQVDVQRFAPSLWKEIDTFRTEIIMSRISVLIARAKKEGAFREDVNEQVVLFMFLNSVQSIVNPEVLSRNAFSPKEAMYTIFHVIFEGSLTDEARREFKKYELSIT